MTVFLGCADSVQHSHDNKNAHEHDATIAPAEATTRKWQADEPTHRNVSALQKLAAEPQYRDGQQNEVLATKLQAGLDQLVKECRMTGPAHDALHHWLEEMLQRTRDLKKAGGDQQAAYQAVRDQLQAFNESFK